MTAINASCGINEIELMDGSNCATTADRICDTPPDYLFAFSSVGGPCGLSNDVFDLNGDLVITMANNVMSYFEGCDEYEFTADQISLMRADFNSPQREYIRSTYVPTTAEINPSEALTVLNPANNSTEENYNSVNLEWNEIANAEMYSVKVISAGGDQWFYDTPNTSLFLTNLSADTYYIWSVLPYNESSGCHLGTASAFFTGSGTTSVNDIEGINQISISPNPSVMSDQSIIHIESSELMDISIEIVDTAGKLLSQQRQLLSQGMNQIPLNLEGLYQGIYFVRVRNNEQQSTKRLVIQ